MNDLKIDEEFQKLIPPLSAEEYQQLETNILKDGIMDSLVVWDNDGDRILIDGHNRYEIAKKHNLPYNERRMEFPDRGAVKEWIIKNQLGRRNIPKYVRAELVLKLKPMIAEKAKERMLAGKADPAKKSAEGETRQQLAKAAEVSHDTIHKVEVISQKAPEETKEALRRGELSINSVYSGIMAAEHEDKRQKEARELREAKRRHDDYQEQKSEGVVNFQSAKQDNEDKRRIFEALNEDIRKLDQHIRHFAYDLENGHFKQNLAGATKEERNTIYQRLRNMNSTILKMQREVIDFEE